MTPPLDPYFYARADGRWVVKGPAPDRAIYGEVVLDVPALDKNIAYIVGKLLSANAALDDRPLCRRLLKEADDLLHSLVGQMPEEPGNLVELHDGKVLE